MTAPTDLIANAFGILPAFSRGPAANLDYKSQAEGVAKMNQYSPLLYVTSKSRPQAIINSGPTNETTLGANYFPALNKAGEKECPYQAYPGDVAYEHNEVLQAPGNPIDPPKGSKLPAGAPDIIAFCDRAIATSEREDNMSRRVGNMFMPRRKSMSLAMVVLASTICGCGVAVESAADDVGCGEEVDSRSKSAEESAIESNSVELLGKVASPGPECANADPSRVVAAVSGDFEITEDPQDPLGTLVYTANSVNGAGKVVVARIDGLTGSVVGGTLTTVADNWNGVASVNGPEFVQLPNGSLGILFRNTAGVHGVFRSSPPAAWNDFHFTVNGARVVGSPPLLPSTKAGTYQGPGMIFGQNTYLEYTVTPKRAYYGSLSGGKLTDLLSVMASQGLSVEAAAMSPRDGYLFMNASGGRSGAGIYEAHIDNMGGIESLVKLAAASITGQQETLRAIRHPANGSTVLFAKTGSNQITVWRQASSGGALTLLKTVAGQDSGHYRTLANKSMAFLHYGVKDGSARGSYTLPVTANGDALVVGAAKKIATEVAGVEPAWLSPVKKWALFFRSNGGFTRCFFTP